MLPSLTSLCLVLTASSALYHLNDQLAESLVVLCRHHRTLKHLELYFEHNHKTWEITDLELGEEDDGLCARRVLYQIRILRNLVRLAEVSITLHHQSYCVENCYYHPPFYHSETVGVHTLRVFESKTCNAEHFWNVKTSQLLQYYQDPNAVARTNFDEFRDDEQLDDLRLLHEDGREVSAETEAEDNETNFEGEETGSEGQDTDGSDGDMEGAEA